jgi:D-beta-D-heptose 7-phosphate kinase/D-beta-D-heptose 1-phosphate adenosyltransferase
MNHPRKVQTAGELQPLLEKIKKEGRMVVFTNGCFDILHVGHVRYLQAARDLGDVLVVGLNSDASVREIKGDLRPLISQDDRAEVLAALACVDFVVIFPEPTPLAVITALRPQVLVKGGDWPLDQIVGRDIVEGSGGRVCTIPVVEGASTSSLIHRVMERYGRGIS